MGPKDGAEADRCREEYLIDNSLIVIVTSDSEGCSSMYVHSSSEESKLVVGRFCNLSFDNEVQGTCYRTVLIRVWKLHLRIHTCAHSREFRCRALRTPSICDVAVARTGLPSPNSGRACIFNSLLTYSTNLQRHVPRNHCTLSPPRSTISVLRHD